LKNAQDISGITDKPEKHGKYTWPDMGPGDTLILKHVNLNDLDNSDLSW
jgi:hypothetical protein